MKFSAILVLALAAEVTVASNWFSKAGTLCILVFNSSLHTGGIFATSAIGGDECEPPLMTECAAYNKWHQTELERWLSDHDIPYPTPADRKDLEDIVKQNWETKVHSPYNEWDTETLKAYLSEKGQQGQEITEQSKESLISQVKGAWYETEDKAEEAYNSVKDWFFDRWVSLPDVAGHC